MEGCLVTSEDQEGGTRQDKAG